MHAAQPYDQWKMSYSSICRSRMKSHFKLSSSLKANFSAHVPLIIHVDGKILPALWWTRKRRSSCHCCFGKRRRKTSRVLVIICGICLLSDVVPVESKRLMVARLQETLGQQELDRRSIRCTVTQDMSIKNLDSFIGPFSGFFFDALQLDTSFFEEDVKNWPLIRS